MADHESRRLSGRRVSNREPCRSDESTPDRHRLAILTWTVVYPVLTVLLYMSEPLVTQLILPLRTLVLSGILVPFLVYVGMPVATRRFDRWLHPNATR